MTNITRREMIAGVTSLGLLTAMRHEGAADAPQRVGKPLIKAGIAAFSYRRHLTGRAQPEMTMLDFVRLAAEMGWDGVELTSYYFPDPLPPNYLAELKRVCFIEGLQVCGASVGNVFTYPPGPARDTEVAKVKTWLRRAAALGAPVLRVFAGAPQPGQTVDEAVRCCLECLEACLETAAEVGVVLGLENHGGIVADAEGMLRILRQVSSPWLGANLDTGNFQTADPYRDMEQVAPYAVTTHLKTEINPLGGPKKAADIPRIVRILARAGYRGFLTLEHEAEEPVEKAAPEVLAAIRRAVTALSQ